MTEHPTLAAALVAALADLTVVEKGRKVDFKTKDGQRINYDYADLPATVAVTRPVLAEHGVVALTPVHDHGNGLACTVILLHTSGERMDLGPFPFPHGRDAQATGSMVTYHRRYALTAALGMAAGDDDDGAAAQPREEAPPVPGFRSSLMKTVEKLTDAERACLRDWLKEEGLPDRPSLMDAEQAGRTVDYILHGLPQVESSGEVAPPGPGASPEAPSEGEAA